MGVDPLVAHFFVFYFAVFSTLTPPVAVSALAAAKVSGGTFFGTAIEGMKLMLTTFIIPFGFCYHPQLLHFPNVGQDVIPIICLLVALQFSLAGLCYGHLFADLRRIDRWILFVITGLGFFVLVSYTLIPTLLFLASCFAFSLRIIALRRLQKAVSI